MNGLLKPLHSNLNKENAKRIAFSFKNLGKIVNNFEDTLEIKQIRGSKLTLAYVADKTFKRKPGWEYESFGKFDKRILSSLNDNFMSWVSKKRREFKENIFVFDDEEEANEPNEEESDIEDSENEDSDSDSECSDMELDESESHHLSSLCSDLLEKVKNLKK